MPVADPDRGLAGSSAFIATAGSLIVALGLTLASLRFAGANPPEQGVEGALGSIALGAVISAPGLLALLALADRPALLLPAATLLMPLSFLSLAGATLPLLIPAVMLFVAYGRRSTDDTVGPGRAAATTAAVLVLLIGALAALFVHEDPRSYETATGGGSTSDVITAAEALISLALTAAAVLAGRALSARRG